MIKRIKRSVGGVQVLIVVSNEVLYEPVADNEFVFTMVPCLGKFTNRLLQVDGKLIWWNMVSNANERGSR